MPSGSAEDSFEDFVRRHAGSLHAMACSYLRDGAEAEDAVQSAFLKSWERWGEMRENPRRDAWVARVVRNECIDRWRRERHRRRYEREALESARNGSRIGGLPGGGGAGGGIDGVEELDRIRAAIAAMPEPYRLVLALRFLEKRSYQEIARSLGKPLGTVKTNLCRAVRRVRLELRRHGCEEG